MKIINLPFTDETIKTLKAGDRLSLNGKVLVARDAAHGRIVRALENKEELPFNLKGATIYYMGPSPSPPGEVIGAAGPTTAHRMDKYAPELYDRGVRATIGKGKRGEDVTDSIKRNKGLYLSAVGGAGALYQDRIVNSRVVCYPDLGPEAVLEIEVNNFPVIVAIDSNGESLYKF